MVSFQTALLLTLSTLASANTVSFTSLDSHDRTVYIHNDVNHPQIMDGSVHVPAGASVTVPFTPGWIGMWYAVIDGNPDPGKGMLGEVSFNGYAGMTYFDVSAIDMPDDHSGVHRIWGVGDADNVSGCVNFPCNDAYYHPDDVQTKATAATDLICTLDST